MAVQDLPKDKIEKRVSRSSPGMGLRRRIVREYLKAGEPGTVDQLARKMRKGIEIGRKADDTPIIRKIHVTTRMVYRDIQVIRAAWESDEANKMAKEEIRTRLNDVYIHARRIMVDVGNKALERVSAARLCYDMNMGIAKLDGHIKRDITVEAGGVLNMEHKELTIMLNDKENAVVPAEAELISD